jgi:PAS domain S-box-containing protein
MQAGGFLSKAGTARFSWPLITIYILAVVGGLVLVLGFVRFNALHQEFLSANFDSVHGARTLLKARLLIELSAHDLEQAALQPGSAGTLLQTAGKRLRNAEHYVAEGQDHTPETRNKLVERIGEARYALAALQRTSDSTPSPQHMQRSAKDLQRLAQDVDAAELDSWGTLSGLNKALGARMRTMNQLLSATFLLFIGVMIVLGWALLRTRRAESALLAAKQMVEAIQQTTLEASPIGIAIVDTNDPENHRVQTVNRQMAAIFGYEADMMPGLSTRRLHSGMDVHRRLAAEAPQRLSGGEVLREEVVMQRRNGMPFWCALSIKAIDSAHFERGIVWTCEDISERKAAEVELQQERFRAEAASRAKSEFLANMSHELRTPFTGLFGLLDLLDRSRLDDNQRRHLDLARSSAEQMQSIVNDILDFSKIEAGKLIIEHVPFRLRELLAAIADTHIATAERKGLKFTLDIVEPLIEALRGDPVRIRQIVDNLLSNAVKFTEYGEVRLSVQTQSAANGMASLRITVEDTGIGIPVDTQMQIFEKFTQADSSTTRMYGGSGLGLAICKQLATLMDGRISLTSSQGRGSRFILQLRLPLSADNHLAVRCEKSPETRIDGVVAVLADDNAANRTMLAETLEFFGAVVWTASTGEEAIGLVNDHHPDIVLMDCQMPGMDGLEATRRIRADEPPGRHLPIVALTAFATSTYRDQCLAPGMMDRFMSKPVNTNDLLACIRQLLSSSDGETVASIAEPPSSTQSSLAGHVLLVDDNVPILESTRAMLTRFGCQVTTASDGSHALALLESATDHAGNGFDLVLMDCQMPILDGRETARRWRERERVHRLPPIAIIAVTADDRPETQLACREAGMDGILVKPFTESGMHVLLAEWLH